MASGYLLKFPKSACDGKLMGNAAIYSHMRIFAMQLLGLWSHTFFEARYVFTKLSIILIVQKSASMQIVASLVDNLLIVVSLK